MPPYMPVGVVAPYAWGSRWCRTQGTPAPSVFRSTCRCVCVTAHRKTRSAPHHSPHTLQYAVVGVAYRVAVWQVWSAPSSHTPSPGAVCRSHSGCSDKCSLSEQQTLWPRPLANLVHQAPPPNNSAQKRNTLCLEHKTSWKSDACGGWVGEAQERKPVASGPQRRGGRGEPSQGQRSPQL